MNTPYHIGHRIADHQIEKGITQQAMADLDLDALTELEKKATSRPWEPTGGQQIVQTHGPYCMAVVAENGSYEDRAFIAAIRNAAPALIVTARRVEDLERENERLRKIEDAALQIEECTEDDEFVQNLWDVLKSNPRPVQSNE